ncbi:hypothetical protein CEXT_444601 [Caerostris extrusa]|uniref:Uncharacterized protein n=1 Tax=Caerostris extrusa TaxID=172846 RepID=A0AAV4W524_CAEEX|nr:hypothetical protein CEXT_444601 [Caerostris extrusa]
MEVILKRQIKASTKGNKAAQHGGAGDVGVSVAGASGVPAPGPGEGGPVGLSRLPIMHDPGLAPPSSALLCGPATVNFPSSLSGVNPTRTVPIPTYVFPQHNLEQPNPTVDVFFILVLVAPRLLTSFYCFFFLCPTTCLIRGLDD